MEFYSMEQFEIMGNILEDLEEWEAFERDCESNPRGEEFTELDEFYFEGMYGEF